MSVTSNVPWFLKTSTFSIKDNEKHFRNMSAVKVSALTMQI